MMTRQQKIETLAAMAAGKLTIDSLTPPIEFFVVHCSDKPDLYRIIKPEREEMNKLQYEAWEAEMDRVNEGRQNKHTVNFIEVEYVKEKANH